MSTSKISLIKGEYVRINLSLRPMIIEAREGEIRVSMTDNKPSPNNGAYHRVRDGYPLALTEVDSNVWAYADANGVKAVVTEYEPEFSTLSQFGEQLTVEKTPILELNSSYGTSLLRDIVVLENGGTQQLAPSGEIQIQTGTNANGNVSINSAEIGRYIPGFGAEIGLGVRGITTPTGSQQARWGGLTPNEKDGLYFLWDANGIAVVRRNDNVENIVRQADWNLDKLDGNGRSKIVLNINEGKIYQVDYTWYGYGAIVFGLVDTAIGGQQRFIPVHRFQSFSDTSVQSPNLKVFIEAGNGGTTASNLDIRLGGRQYSIIGKYIPKYRFTGDRRASTALSTTVKPLVSFRRKAAFSDRSIKLAGYSLVNTGTTPVYIEIRINGTLTGFNFLTPTDYTASETALESDLVATAITGGLVAWSGEVVGSGQGVTPSLSDREVDLDIPDGAIVTLCAASFSGTPNVVSALRLQEEW